MGWLEAGEAIVFPCSLQESTVWSSAFTPDTTKELGDSGMIKRCIKQELQALVMQGPVK